MPGFEVIGEEERAAVNEVFDNGGILFAHGFDALRNGVFKVREFEKKFAEKINVKHAQALSSGTASLKVALKAAGVESGDEVITQAFNFIADVEAILDAGATPVITNIDETLNMDINDLRERITEKTKAVIVVHMLGVSANITEIQELCREKGIILIEDNCESLGATWDGKHLGTFGDIGVFSFDFGKTITCGEGGMLVTNEEKYFKYAREYHDHGHENNPKFPRGKDTHTIYGFNYRMTELQAAVGLAQLKKLDMIVEKNTARYNQLKETLSGFELRLVHDQNNPLCDTFMIKVTDENLRQKCISHLIENGFGTKNVPDAIEWHCAYFWDHALSKEEIEHCHESFRKLNEYVAIPIALKKTEDQYKELANSLKELLS